MEATLEERIVDAKVRAGWSDHRVYTVIGEYGNSTGPYTDELPSMAAALEAIRRDDLPLSPRAEGGLRQDGNIVSFTVSRSLCYYIVEHEPHTKSDPITGWSFGGIHDGHRRVFRLADGSAVIAGEQPLAIPDEAIPPEWRAYRERLAALPPRNNYITVYRDVLA